MEIIHFQAETCWLNLQDTANRNLRNVVHTKFHDVKSYVIVILK